MFQEAATFFLELLYFYEKWCGRFCSRWQFEFSLGGPTCEVVVGVEDDDPVLNSCDCRRVGKKIVRRNFYEIWWLLEWNGMGSSISIVEIPSLLFPLVFDMVVTDRLIDRSIECSVVDKKGCDSSVFWNRAGNPWTCTAACSPRA